MARLFTTETYQENSTISNLYRKSYSGIPPYFNEPIYEHFLSVVLLDINNLYCDITKSDIIVINLVLNGLLTRNTCIFDGSKLIKLEKNVMIPQQFSVLTRYPTNHWNNTKKILFVTFDITPYMKELLLNASSKLFDDKITISLAPLKQSFGHLGGKKSVVHRIVWTKFNVIDSKLNEIVEDCTPQLYKDIWSIIHEYSMKTYYIILYNYSPLNTWIEGHLKRTKYFETVSVNAKLNFLTKEYIDNGNLLFVNLSR